MKRIRSEILILIIILVIIGSLEFITNCVSKKSVDKILGQLDDVMKNLEKVEEEDESEEVRQALEEMNELESEDKKNLENVDKEVDGINEKIKKLKDDWFKEEAKLSFFAEHDELEKISYAIVILEENSINHEYDEALDNIVEAKFWLEHVYEKDSFRLKNIF